MAVHILGQHAIVHTSQYRIWAEGGFVRIEDKTSGDYKTFSPEQFKPRLDALADLRGNTRRKREMKAYPMLAADGDLLNKLQKIYRQALEQMTEIRRSMRAW